MKQFAIIGLGNFGKYLAMKLFEMGHDVLAVDRDPKKVQEVMDVVTQAVVMDATEMHSLETLGIKDVDCAIVTIGTSLGDSVLVTINLKELGIKEVYAKAISEVHGKILKKLGVSRVFFPEMDMANLVAERLHNPSILEQLPYLRGYVIFEIMAPKAFWGKTLKALDLRNRYDLMVLAVKGSNSKDALVPSADYSFREGDAFICLGPQEALELLRRDYPEKG